MLAVLEVNLAMHSLKDLQQMGLYTHMIIHTYSQDKTLHICHAGADEAKKLSN